MSQYCVFRSTDSREYFPENQSYSFKVLMTTSLNKRGNSKIALVEVCSDTDLNEHELYLYCNICSESILGGSKNALLRWIPSGHGRSIEFQTLIYVPIIIRDVKVIQFEIRDKYNKPALFLTDQITVSVLISES